MSDPHSTLSANLASPGLSHLRGVVSLDAVEKWRVEWSEPFPSLSLEVEGKWLSLASRRAPLDEARRQIEEARGSDAWPPLVVLLGAGLGFAVDAIEATAPLETRVLVIEPFAPAAAALLARRDWHALLETGRLHVVAGPQFGGSSDLWRLIDVRQPPLVVEHPVLARARPDAVAAARKILARATFDASANAEARETLGGRYLVNTLCNLPRILAGPDLRDWQNARAGQPVVVCGAGPSLNANLVDLAAYRDDVTLVAVDTSLRPILESGFTPDLVVALDPSPLNARHLSGLTLPDRTWLVSEAALDPAAFDSFGDRVAFFRVGDNDPWPWLAEQGVDVPVLAAWGSVLTSAFALAEWLGADPLVLMGADLAFTGGQPYCRGTMFEVDWARAVLEGQTLAAHWRRQIGRRPTQRVTAIDGTEVDTAPHLLAFRDWLVDRAAKSGRSVINATGAGILSGPAIQHGLTGVRPLGRRGLPLPSERPSPGSDPVELHAKLAALREDQAPLADWIASYQRSLDRAMLDTALGQYAQYVGQGFSPAEQYVGRGFSLAKNDRAAEAPPHVRRGLIALPESVAIIRDARDGVAAPAWAMESPAWAYAGRSFSSGINVRFPDAAGIAGAEAPAYVPGHLHQLFAFEWSQPAIEALSTLLIDVARELRAAPPGTALRQRFRGTPRAGTASPAPRSAGRQARAFVASVVATQWATRHQTPSSRTLLDALDAINVAVAQPPATFDATLRLTVASVDDAAHCWRVSAAVPTEQLATILRGAVLATPDEPPHLTQSGDGLTMTLGWRTRSIDADVLHRDCVGVVPHRVLTDEGLPKCLIMTAALDGTAIATPRGQTASFRVLDDGRFERMAEWPAPIVGEAHGPVGQVAWTYTTPARLLFRENAAADVTPVEVAFQVYSVSWWQNHVVMTTDDGLWQWEPGRAPRRVASLPPAVIVRLDGNRLEADPLPLESGRLTRRRLDRGWTIDLATGDMADRFLAPPGQRWTEHSLHGRTAAGVPQADAVAMRDQGVERWLVWPSPRAALWIDRSVLLNTTSGDVVLIDLSGRFVS